MTPADALLKNPLLVSRRGLILAYYKLNQIETSNLF